MQQRIDCTVDFLVSRIDEDWVVDLALTRIALGVWNAEGRRVRRLAELTALLVRLSASGAAADKLQALAGALEKEAAPTPLHATNRLWGRRRLFVGLKRS